jgi:4-alpha-glucanotransferase
VTEPAREETNRSAGILLHPTSLPGPYGIGDLGKSAYTWVDGLVLAKQTWWQVLPLGPTGYGDSPYQCFSAFAGNPYLVDPDSLVRDGLIDRHDLASTHFADDHVEFGAVIDFKVRMIARAWENFQAGSSPSLRADFDSFCREQASWLNDYALFRALKDAHGGKSWLEWQPDLVVRKPAALEQARNQLASSIGLHQFGQFLFFRQWRNLKTYAHQHGIKLIGDVPIFVSSDSADVWANPELFHLNEMRRPTFVAGVPPDYFSTTGQLWGNPLYRWDKLRETGYAWWIARVRATLEQVDLIRLDHFRGFEAYWEIPAGMPTAEIGRWVKGPGAALFAAVRIALGEVPFIAEDLGLITAEVEALRKELGFPGMRILQFAFSDPDNKYLPHHYERNTVVYTGTHDNDISRAWYASISPKEKEFVQRYLGREIQDVSWDLMRLAWASTADHAIAPLQDVLGLGGEARMNMPSRATGNWGWRFTQEMLTQSILERLAELTELYSRYPLAEPEAKA